MHLVCSVPPVGQGTVRAPRWAGALRDAGPGASRRPARTNVAATRLLLTLARLPAAGRGKKRQGLQTAGSLPSRPRQQ
jgi:hypothetical protein